MSKHVLLFSLTATRLAKNGKCVIIVQVQKMVRKEMVRIRKYILLLVAIFALFTSSFAITYTNMKIYDSTLTYAATFAYQTLNASAATVVRVKDGDTIVVDVAAFKNVTVRLLGVDTPEDVDPRKPVQFYSLEAASFTAHMLTGKRVYLTYDTNKYDVFGRTLAYVWIKSGDEYVMFDALLIINGYGKYYPTYKFRTDYMDLFARFQQYAQEQNMGMWQEPSMVGKTIPLTIVRIEYSGKDEYVQIQNVSNQQINLKGWKIASMPMDKQIFVFHSIILQPGESVYVHSGPNAGANKMPGINIVWTKKYIWEDSGDACALIDASGNVVDNYEY